VALAIDAYVLGWWRLDHDDEQSRVGPWRLLLSLTATGMGLWLITGLNGHHLGFIEGFFPGDSAP
jgi:thiol:disulfide interchange protein DsbD